MQKDLCIGRRFPFVCSKALTVRKERIDMAAVEKIAVATRDYHNQLHFYRDVLGLPLLSELGGVAVLTCGKQVLLISDLGCNPGADAVPHTGDTEELEYTIWRIDRDAWTEHLRRLGHYADRDSFADYDGNRLHFRYGEPTAPGFGPVSKQ
jgi:catechol 2,3-dioxygenase-like lactoylglutathione lyase family enzyme